MQGLARQVTALRPEFVNNDCTFGELAWVYGKDHAVLGANWRHRLWWADGEVVAWGWLYPPYRIRRSNGQDAVFDSAYLAWQVHPDRPELLDEVLEWCLPLVPAAVDLRTNVRAADTCARTRLAAHGFGTDEPMAADDGFWQQMNRRELTDLEAAVLPDGFRFTTAREAGAEAAVRAHVEAWHPSTFTAAAYEGVRAMWPYRDDLHIMVEAPDGTPVASVVIWLDAANATAEFEPVGTHREFRRLGLAAALLRRGMHAARAAGARHVTVSCLAGAGHAAARELYLGVGFRPFTHDVPQILPAGDRARPAAAAGR